MLTVKLKNLHLMPGSYVLDLGCGEGRHVHGLRTVGDLNIIGLDLNFASLGKAAQGLDYVDELNPDYATGKAGFVQASAYALPFPDSCFDAVICSEVLEHLENYPQVITEIKRVLKPGCVAAITIPHAWPERICWKLAPPPNGYPFEPGGHIRIFDDVHLKYEFMHYGFQFVRKHHAHGLHAPFWWLKTAFWDRRDDHPLVVRYHSFLVWDLMKQPTLTRWMDKILSPVIGKSVALYFRNGTIE